MASLPTRYPNALLCAALAALTLLGGCGAPQRNNAVDFLWTSGRGRATTEGTSRARVSISPNADRKVRIAVVEDQAMQTGQMMRASVWVAATQAALAVDADLSRWRTMVELDTNGMRVDGPSAGALFTASMMAALRGKGVKSDVTMTGTVNPDGTIGPVGGIPRKLRAAAKAGKKVVGYPTGQQFSRDPRTGKMVDLKRLAGKLGVQAVEVNDLYEAYELLTGDRIDRPEALSKAQMALPPHVNQAVQGRAKAWIKGLVNIYKRYQKMSPPNAKPSSMWTKAAKLLKSAKTHLNEGSPAAGYRDAKRAFLLGDRALVIRKYVRATAGGNLVGADQMYKQIRSTIIERMGKLYTHLRASKPHHESDVITLTDAFEAANESMREMQNAAFAYKLAKRDWARAMRNKADPKAMRQVRYELYRPLGKMAACNLHAGEARHHLRFRDKSGKVERILAEDISHLAHGLRGAANANLTYFEATVLKPVADAKGMSQAAVRQKWRGKTYRNARMSNSVRKANNKLLRKGTLAHAVAELATALHIYHAGAALVAQHYSVKLKGDESNFTRVGRRKAFRMMIETAELAARQHAARSKRITGRVPVAAQLAYQLGRDIRDSANLTDKFAALRAFWRSSLHSRLVVMLHRIRATRQGAS